MIREIAHLLAPWKHLYSDSTVVSTTVTGAHIVALVTGGGIAIAADRTTLRALNRQGPTRQWLLEELHAVHRPVLIGLTLLFLTGVLLVAADFETFVVSVVFWVKIGLLTALLANGVVLYSAETRLREAAVANVEAPPALYRKLRRSARLSIALWLLITVGGAMLTSAA